MTERGFLDWLHEFRLRGAVNGLPSGTPVLVRYGGKELIEGQDRAFRTAFGRVEQTDASLIDASSTPGRKLGAVILILKKEGAPFPDQIGVGRAANTDVCLALNTISKYHAFFCADAKGKYSVTDAGSKNGSWKDGVRLAPRQPAALVDGSRLRLGAHKFLFYSYPGFLRLLETQPE
jgi:hypothetical protein